MGDYSEYRDREIRGLDGITNAIILKRQYPGNEFLSFLMVEGDTDKKLYKRFINENRCNITITYTKSIALAVLSILEQIDFPGILVIVDTDFDALEGLCWRMTPGIAERSCSILTLQSRMQC